MIEELAALGAGLYLLMKDTPDIRSRWTPPPEAAPYLEAIRAAEAEQGLPEGLLARLLYQESGYRPEVIRGEIISPAGAVGIAQVLPTTAASPGFGTPPLQDPTDPAEAIPWAARYLRGLREYFGNWPEAIAAYNWGPGAVSLHGLALAPAETRAYLAAITADVELPA